MKKIAIFVEGQTEQLFVEKLINQIADTNEIVIEARKLTGGNRTIPGWIRLWTSASSTGRAYFFLIVDSGGDNTVKSDIRDNYQRLVSEGYNVIIGIRDVYPQVVYSDIPKLRSMLNYGMRTVPIQVGFVLGVMEIETWFICEYTHFGRVDPTLTTAVIKSNLGFDPAVDDVQLRAIPSDDLDKIYQLVGHQYQKDYNSIQVLLNQLDYTLLYCDVRNRLPDLNALIESIDTFFTP